MVYGDVDKIRLMTGWSSSDISTTTLDELVEIADTWIDATGFTFSTAEKQKISNLLACHLGEKYFHGDKQNININGISIAMRTGEDSSSWLNMAKNLMELSSTGGNVYKVN